MLMVMRPYQITATERILNRIEIAHNYKKYGILPPAVISGTPPGPAKH
jgi:hypothetical protein